MQVDKSVTYIYQGLSSVCLLDSGFYLYLKINLFVRSDSKSLSLGFVSYLQNDVSRPSNSTGLYRTVLGIFSLTMCLFVNSLVVSSEELKTILTCIHLTLSLTNLLTTMVPQHLLCEGSSVCHVPLQVQNRSVLPTRVL